MTERAEGDNGVRTNGRPLDGVRVLELGQLIAGPFAGSILGYFGAEVIKIEPLTGDPLREWRLVADGTSLWWYSIGRNKKSVALDLRREEARQLVRRLACTADVLLESFRPGVVEKWQLGPEDLKRDNPRLIYARVSGYGQTGPYSSRPGFASVCEGVGGFRYVNGFPGQPPVRPNLSLGDTVTGLHAVLGILLALYNRKASRQELGQVVDVAIYESVFNLMEAMIPECDWNGTIREPSGTTITGIVPTNIYPCSDGKYLIIGGNGDAIFRRLMEAVGRPDLAADPRVANNEGRVKCEQELDQAISAWTLTLPASTAVERLISAGVPASLIYNAADILADPHFNARGMFESVTIGGRGLKLPAILPKLTATPGRTDWPGPPLGAHNKEILCGLLGLSEIELERLTRDGIVGAPPAEPLQAADSGG